MKLGKHEDKLRRRLEEGKPTPLMENKPALYPDLTWVWNAWQSLNKRRAAGMNGPQAIPTSEIEAYCRLHNVTDVEEFERLIQAMEDAFMEYVDGTRNKDKH